MYSCSSVWRERLYVDVAVYLGGMGLDVMMLWRQLQQQLQKSAVSRPCVCVCVLLVNYLTGWQVIISASAAAAAVVNAQCCSSHLLDYFPPKPHHELMPFLPPYLCLSTYCSFYPNFIFFAVWHVPQSPLACFVIFTCSGHFNMSLYSKNKVKQL